MATKKKKRAKRKKLKTIPQINRKLFRLWSEMIRSNCDFKCEICHVAKPESKIDSHHIISRHIKDSPLKFDKRNGISVCPSCHKFGNDSFHKNPLITMQWFSNNRPKDYKFLEHNSYIRLDLRNRAVLAEIEKSLTNKEPLDLDQLKSIESSNPRKNKKKKLNGTLFGDTLEI